MNNKKEDSINKYKKEISKQNRQKRIDKYGIDVIRQKSSDAMKKTFENYPDKIEIKKLYTSLENYLLGKKNDYDEFEKRLNLYLNARNNFGNSKVEKLSEQLLTKIINWLEKNSFQSKPLYLMYKR